MSGTEMIRESLADLVRLYEQYREARRILSR